MKCLSGMLEMRFTRWGFVVGLITLCFMGESGWGEEKVPDDPGVIVERHVRPFLKKHKTPGMIVGVLTASGERLFFPFGKKQSKGEAPDAETLFEIGSVTKTFTALLLADPVVRGELKLEDSVQKLLPAEFVVPKRGERELSLLELATHTSGLPENPPELILEIFKQPELQRNPFQNYDEARLRECLRGLKLSTEEKPVAMYSNLGMGLLGEALSRKAGKSYDELLQERIAGPLGMTRTTARPPSSTETNAARGHAGRREEVPYWEFASLAGCGAICSTAEDMLTYLEAQSGRRESALSEAMVLTQRPRESFMFFYEIGLGWIVEDLSGGRRFWWHNGGTNGFSTYAAFCRDPAVGVIVLCNHGPDGLEGLLRMDSDTVGERILKGLMKGGGR